ncbi:MAG: hypothetical protein E4H01_02965 [Lysobacterales bacterium]|nr:MAG: hypothetical protein E4H01_02965 [Xanthomonadales bacterium]
MKDPKDWIAELEIEEKAHKAFRVRAQKVVDAYEDEKERDTSEFNILWSNVEVLHSALYGKTPNPDVRRRYLDKDKAGKQAAELAERAVSYALDVYDFDGAIDAAVDDYLIAGLGIVRVRYEPFYETKPGEPRYLEERVNGFSEEYEPTNGFFDGDEEVIDYLQDEEGFAYLEGDPIGEVVYEEVKCEPVNWKRFRWQASPRWEDVTWSAIEHYMDEDELKDAYPDHYKQIPLGYTINGEKAIDADEKARARIFEIFDKKTRKNIEIAEGYAETLKETEDPLSLEGFWPFPKPLVTTTKNGIFVPIPDYVFYQDQAKELDRVTARINALTEHVKYRGVYDASFTALSAMENAEDGTFIGIDDFQALVNAGGGGQGDLNKVMATMPLDQLIQALRELYVAREQIKQTIYEITGIADIMRGSTSASETLGAQQLKTQFGSMRMSKRQRRVASFVRDIIRLKVEVMVENFQPQTLEMMTGIELMPGTPPQPPPMMDPQSMDQYKQAMQQFEEKEQLKAETYKILTDDLMRSYRIDIETDSTITEDAQVEKQGRIEMVGAITTFLKEVGPLVQAQLIPQNIASELLGFAVRGFKVGRTLEDSLDELSGSDDDPKMRQMMQQMEQAKQQMQQQAQEQISMVQQEAGKEIETLKGKLYEVEKGRAVDKAVDNAKIYQTQVKADIDERSNKYETELKMLLELFREQVRLAQAEPIKRMGDLDGSLSEVMTIIQQRDQSLFDTIGALQSQINSTTSDVGSVRDMLNRPARAVKQKDGSWLATRDE